MTLEIPHKVPLDKVRREWAERARAYSGNTTLAGEFNNGDSSTSDRFTICHAFLADGCLSDYLFNYPQVFRGRMKLESLVGAANGVVQDHDDYIIWADFHRFLMNDELLGQAFITKDIVEAAEYGCIMDLECPSAIAMTAMVASRRPKEFPHKVRYWYELKELGMHPRLALWMSEMCEAVTGRGPFQFRQYTDGHQTFGCPYTDVTGFKNVAKGVMTRPSANQRQSIRYGYSSFNDAFSGHKADYDKSEFYQHLQSSATEEQGWSVSVAKEYRFWEDCEVEVRCVQADDLKSMAKTAMKLLEELAL